MKLLILLCFFLLSKSYAEGPMTTVESDLAQYDGVTLSLKGHVVVDHPLGHLIAEQAYLKKDVEGMGRLDFPWLKLTQDVRITFASGGFLECQTIDLDYKKSQAFLEGPPQLYYKDTMGELYADQAFIDYCESQGKIQPLKVTLLGNVQMIGSSTKKESAQPTPYYALADHVEYFPSEQRMVLQSQEGRRVLFYDGLKEMQLSARTVYACRDPIDGHDSVQGLGDVRFVFKQDELEKLKQRFNW